MKSVVFSCVFVCIVLRINAELFRINTVADFKDFAEKVSQGISHDAILLKDLDFSEDQLACPIGYTGESYSGVFDGNGHRLSNINMRSSDAGLFFDLQHAQVRNLIIDASCSFTAMHSGSVAVYATVDVRLYNITNKAKVQGVDCVGGFIGDISNAKGSIEIVECINEGDVSQTCGLSLNYVYVGGVIGQIIKNENDNLNITIINTTNRGNVTGCVYIGGFIGSIKDSDNLVLNVKNCTNDGNCTGTMESPGFTNDISLSSAGFVSVMESSPGATIDIDGFVNNGNIFTNIDGSNGKTCAGGVIALGSANDNLKMTIKNSENNGLVKVVDGDASFVGGFVGLNRYSSDTEVNLINNTNNGSLITEDNTCCIGGIVAAVTQNTQISFNLMDNTNNAELKSQGEGDAAIGGIVGIIEESKSTIVINHGVNNGVVNFDGIALEKDNQETASMIGYINVDETDSTSIVLRNCENTGKISGYSDGLSSGLVSLSSTSLGNINLDIFNCINKGSVVGKETYGIAKVVDGAKNVVSMGSVEGIPSLTFAFWDSCSQSSSLFSFGKCEKCPERAVIFHNATQVAVLLNSVATSEGYEYIWDESLDLRLRNSSSSVSSSGPSSSGPSSSGPSSSGPSSSENDETEDNVVRFVFEMLDELDENQFLNEIIPYITGSGITTITDVVVTKQNDGMVVLTLKMSEEEVSSVIDLFEKCIPEYNSSTK